MSAPAILCVGLSHRTAPLAVRERFALVGRRADQLTTDMLASECIDECVVLNTCNRSELYLVTTDTATAMARAARCFSELAQIATDELQPLMEVHDGAAAVRHILRVAAGVESVVVGEAQIVAQVRQAIETSRSGGTAGPVLNRLFDCALQAGKQARSQTQITHGRASVGSIAADLVRRALGSLDGLSALLIGAGSMSELTAQHLQSHGLRQVFVANRHVGRAEQLAERFSGAVADFAQLGQQLATCDIVVSSTAAPHVVLTKGIVEEGMRQRNGRSLVLVDLAVPRDIDAAVGSLDGCHLYDLDDLERTVAETMTVRRREVAKVETILETEVRSFLRWHSERSMFGDVVALRTRAEQIRLAELDRFAARFAHLSAADREHIERLTRDLTNKVLHEPTQQLRGVGNRPAVPEPVRD